MNFKTAKPYQPPLLSERGSSGKIRTRTSEEFFAVCDREKRGELSVRALTAFGPTTGNGGSNGEYEFEVTYEKNDKTIQEI